MKKRIFEIIIAVIVVLVVVWIINTFYNIESKSFDWGLTMDVEYVTNTGLTVVFQQQDGNITGELQTGTYYVLESLIDDEWIELDYQEGLNKNNIGWNAVAHIISLNEETKFNIDWEWLYGKIPSGKYRIGKEVSQFRETANYDSKMYYVEFSID